MAQQQESSKRDNILDDDQKKEQKQKPNTSSDQVTQIQSSPAHSTFSKNVKTFVVVMTILGMMFSPLSSSIILPAIDPLAKQYHTSVNHVNFAVTVFQVMQAIAPMFFADWGDRMGRRPSYLLTFIIYIGANIGLALQSNYAALLVLRALQSTGSSGTVALANGVIADIATAAERGGYISYVQSTVMIAPAIAPVLGGIFAEYLGWRSIFWFLTIAAGVFLILYFFFVPETGRSVVGDGSIPPPKLSRSPISSWQWRRKLADMEKRGEPTDQIPHPKKLSQTKLVFPDIGAAIRIIFEKDVGCLLIFASMFVTTNYCMLVPLQNILKQRYNLSTVLVGVCFLPFSVGSIIGGVLTGKLLNWNYKRVALSIGVTPDRKRGDELRKFPIERARLDIMWGPVLLACATVIAFGWVVAARTSLAAPLVITFIAGICLAVPLGAINSLLVDLYPMNPSRVTSSLNLCRCALSAVGTAVVQYIIDAWGYGWTYVFFGLLTLAFSPSIWIVMKWGPIWREERYVRFEKAAKAKEEKLKEAPPR